ncbi:MAG: hypothetical protein MJZ76_04200 [Bacteroidales bacterium]|nr:hypothetical protein [Bacteroidales bacterium]
MLITFISVRGNHGRGVNENNGVAGPAQRGGLTSTVPQQGNNVAFTMPNAFNVKKTVPIGDVIADGRPANTSSSSTQSIPNPSSKPIQNQVNQQFTVEKQTITAAPVQKPTVDVEQKTSQENHSVVTPLTQKIEEKKAAVIEETKTKPEDEKPLSPEELQKRIQQEMQELEEEGDDDSVDYGREESLDEEDKMALQAASAEKELELENRALGKIPNKPDEPLDELTQNWNAMLANVFAQMKTILFPLKNNPPTIKDNIIYVRVKGTIQEEHFNMKKREVLAYWRNNVDEHIEDVVVHTDENLEAPKMIYDNADKMNHFNEENSEFADFLNILDLKFKD